jgi:hypothetical protein
MKSVLSRYQGKDIRPRDCSQFVWEIAWPRLFTPNRRQRQKAVVACRQELLNFLVSGVGPVFVVHEPPQEYDVPGNWQLAGEATWIVPSDLNLDHPAIKHWLFAIGNWRIYSAPRPIDGGWPDAFRCSVADLLDWMAAKSVRALIESFHDDTDWVVALEHC